MYLLQHNAIITYLRKYRLSAGCASADKGCCCPHPPSPFIIITQPECWRSFCHSTECGRLRRWLECGVVAVDVVGPQTYNVSRGLAAESMYRAYLASTLHGGFGSSAARKGPLNSRDVREQPGPAHYQPPIATPCSAGPPRGRVVRGSSNFTSQSLRIKKPDHLVRARSYRS